MALARSLSAFTRQVFSTPIRKTVTLFNQVDEQRKGKIDQVTTNAQGRMALS